MANDDQKNAFERKQPRSTLADDRKNPFQRHDESVKKARTASDTQDQRQQIRDTQRAAWTHQSDVPTTTSGVRLDANTAKLKVAANADRQARNNAPKQPPPDPVALKAHVLLWRSETPEGLAFPASDFNIESLSNAIQQHLGVGWPVSLDTITAAYNFARDHNHLDFRRRDAGGNIITSRGDKPFGGGAPTLCPPFIWNDERQAADAEALRLEVEKVLAEKTRAEAMSFEQLQSETRKTFRTPKPGAPNLDRTY